MLMSIIPFQMTTSTTHIIFDSCFSPSPFLINKLSRFHLSLVQLLDSFDQLTVIEIKVFFYLMKQIFHYFSTDTVYFESCSVFFVLFEVFRFLWHATHIAETLKKLLELNDNIMTNNKNEIFFIKFFLI